MTKNDIASICHEANRALCASQGDWSQTHWKYADQWQRDSAIKGVEFRLSNPQAPESAQHESWMADKVRDGWVYGVEKNTALKTHPCLVPYDQLPAFQRAKDHLFVGIVEALKPFLACIMFLLCCFGCVASDSADILRSGISVTTNWPSNQHGVLPSANKPQLYLDQHDMTWRSSADIHADNPKSSSVLDAARGGNGEIIITRLLSETTVTNVVSGDNATKRQFEWTDKYRTWIPLDATEKWTITNCARVTIIGVIYDGMTNRLEFSKPLWSTTNRWNLKAEWVQVPGFTIGKLCEQDDMPQPDVEWHPVKVEATNIIWPDSQGNAKSVLVNDGHGRYSWETLRAIDYEWPASEKQVRLLIILSGLNLLVSIVTLGVIVREIRK